MILAGSILVFVLTISALVAFLWHLDRTGQVAIRDDDQVAIYEMRPEQPALQPSPSPAGFPLAGGGVPGGESIL